MPSRKSYRGSHTEARAIRDKLIDMTYRMPEDSPESLLSSWNKADSALFEFVKALKAAEEAER